MSFSIALPFLFLANGIGTYTLLQRYVPSYKTLSYRSQQETLGRWNSMLMQVFLIGGFAMAKTPEQVDFICNVFASYFLTDLLHMIFYSYEPIFYVHHCIPLALYYFGPPFFSPEEARTIYTVGFLLELTTPPISAVWILSKLGFKPRGYLACKVFAYLNFVVVRMILFPYYWYTTMAFWPKIVVAPFHVMNVYWFFAMTKYVIKSGND